MRRQIGKPIAERRPVCRVSARVLRTVFARKTLFHVRLPGERETDLEGILEMSKPSPSWPGSARAAGGRRGERVELCAEPQTPFQWNAMQCASISFGRTSSCIVTSDCEAAVEVSRR